MTIGDRIAVAALATALVAAGLGAWLVMTAITAAEPSADQAIDPFGTSPATLPPVETGTLIVDVEGAVVRPGVIELTSGSRVADAIAAAGGYTPDADLIAAAAQVNLAAVLRDGQQIVVPVLGAPAGGAGGGTTGGLVNLNTATSEALDALPGIGPVTAQKIVAARVEQPFGSLEELVTRKVLTSAQLDKIRALATV